MKLERARTHLTYCTNIHPGETWPDVFANLQRFLPAVKRRVSPQASFGVGLRLSAQAAEQLDDDAAIEALQDFLRREQLYIFTLNGFPHGAFHGTRVKEQVYRPDWLEDARVTYSNRLARLLERLLPDEGVDFGTISTVPGAFNPRVTSRKDIAAMTRRIVEHASELVAIERRSGKRLVVALEPEPCCFLETSSETAAFFGDYVFAATAIAQLAVATGMSRAQAEEALHRHVGVCFDACHMAVEFESMTTALDTIAGAGIAIPKVQVSAGLELAAGASGDVRDLLARSFGDDVYLHQVVERHAGGLTRYLDLSDALAAEQRGTWRVHFHVPLFHDNLGVFGSTRADAASALALFNETVGTHFEVETYTWDVLPAAFRDRPIDEAIASELTWTLEHLRP